MPDKEMTDYLTGVVGVVDANSFETYCLWKEYYQERKIPWKSRGDGLMEIVGHIGDMPVCLSLLTVEVDGYKLLFITATSQVVDHRMIDKWLEDNLPKTSFRDDGYVNRIDAGNFPNIFRRVSLRVQ